MEFVISVTGGTPCSSDLIRRLTVAVNSSDTKDIKIQVLVRKGVKQDRSFIYAHKYVDEFRELLRVTQAKRITDILIYIVKE